MKLPEKFDIIESDNKPIWVSESTLYNPETTHKCTLIQIQLKIPNQFECWHTCVSLIHYAINQIATLIESECKQ